jgi:hypothetical protein
MIGIRLTAKNLDKILGESPVELQDIAAMVGEADQRGIALYFVPQHDMAHELDRTSWMLLPQALLEEQFDYDASKIEDQFVEVAAKTGV